MGYIFSSLKIEFVFVSLLSKKKIFELCKGSNYIFKMVYRHCLSMMKVANLFYP